MAASRVRGQDPGPEEACLVSTAPSARRLSAVVIAVLLAAAGILAKEPAPTSKDVVVEIGAQQIGSEELIRYLRQGRPGLAFDRLPAAEQKRLVEAFVEKRLLALRARELGLDRSPEVQARIDFFTDGVLSQALREQTQQQVVVSEDEARTYYREHREAFRVPPKYLLEHLLYRRAESAARARDKFLSGVAFDQLALDRGKDSDLLLTERRWFTPELLPIELAEVAAQLARGDVSEVVRSRHGHHILRLVGLDRGRYEEFSEVRPQVEEKVRQARAEALYRELLEEMRSRHSVRIHLGSDR